MIPNGVSSFLYRVQRRNCSSAAAYPATRERREALATAAGGGSDTSLLLTIPGAIFDPNKRYNWKIVAPPERDISVRFLPDLT
jgi:hypothetical protein